MVDAVGGQLPAGEACPLKQGAGLVGVDEAEGIAVMEFVDDPVGRPPGAGGQGSGVAVSDDAHLGESRAFENPVGPSSREFAVCGFILGDDTEGMGEDCVDTCPDIGCDPVDSPGEIDGGWAGVANPVDLGSQALIVPPLLDALVHGDDHTEGTCRSEGGGTTHG